MLGDLLTDVVWTYNTFENNFGIDHRITKYLKENCGLGSVGTIIDYNR